MELYDLETHQKKLGPDYHRLKAMVKRSIEHEIRNENFGTRSGNFEKNAVIKNQGTKQRVQRILGDCWQWETNGQCVEGNICSFRHDMDKRGKSSPSNPSQNSFMQQSERKPSSVKDGILQNACFTKTRMVAVLGRSAHSHIVRLTHSRRNGPNRIMTNALWLY